MQTDNPILTSFLIGTPAYATYAFTIYGIHPEWPLWLTIGETLWGGTLMALTTYVAMKTNVVSPAGPGNVD